MTLGIVIDQNGEALIITLFQKLTGILIDKEFLWFFMKSSRLAVYVAIHGTS